MQTSVIDTPLIELRQNLSAFIEQAHYTDTQIRLTRHSKPLARLVSEKFMRNLEKLFTQNPEFLETLEVMMDQDVMNTIDDSRAALSRGEVLPLADVLKD